MGTMVIPAPGGVTITTPTKPASAFTFPIGHDQVVTLTIHRPVTEDQWALLMETLAVMKRALVVPEEVIP